nr:ribonuclease H-like domain-containing protein [Tanacetum cinerariifolium]
MKEELKSTDFWLEMRAELKVELRNDILAEHNLSPREDDVPSSIELKSSLNSTTNMNESSSTKPVDVSTSVFKIQCIKEETYGCLYVPSFALAGQQVICASATIYPILGDGVIHFQKLRKGHMKVAVLKVMEKHKNMELPMPNDELPYLESALNGFIRWPIFAIGRYKGTSKPAVTEVPTKRLMPQHERAPSLKKGKVNDTPKEPNKKDKASEDTTNKQKSIQRVENEKAANRKSKAFRVFNSRTHIVHETLHVNFMENKPNVTCSGPAWLFDIDSLSKTMNYHPVIAENQSNIHPDGSTNSLNNNKDAHADGKEHDDDIQKSVSHNIHSSSGGAQTRK